MDPETGKILPRTIIGDEKMQNEAIKI